MKKGEMEESQKSKVKKTEGPHSQPFTPFALELEIWNMVLLTLDLRPIKELALFLPSPWPSPSWEREFSEE